MTAKPSAVVVALMDATRVCEDESAAEGRHRLRTLLGVVVGGADDQRLEEAAVAAVAETLEPKNGSRGRILLTQRRREAENAEKIANL